MPSSSRPSMARRTPSTCPAHRCPCATSASHNSWSKVFTIAESYSVLLLFGRGLGHHINAVWAHAYGEALDRLGEECYPRRLPVPAGGQTVRAGQISSGGLSQFLAIHRFLDPELGDNRQQPLCIAGQTAIGRIVAIPAHLGVKRIEVGQFELSHLARTTVHQQPSPELPKPFGWLRGIVGQRIVDAIGPAYHKLTIGDIMRLAGGELFQLGIDVQRTHREIHRLVFRWTNK